MNKKNKVVNLQLNKDALLKAQESNLGIVNKIRIAPSINAAPPTLDGIARKMA